jgi:hypothetical protein
MQWAGLPNLHNYKPVGGIWHGDARPEADQILTEPSPFPPDFQGAKRLEDALAPE